MAKKIARRQCPQRTSVRAIKRSAEVIDIHTGGASRNSVEYESLPRVNLQKVIRGCQQRIANAYATQGGGHALVAVACSSIALQAYVEAGSLIPGALGHIAETARNLGLHERLGEEVMNIALDAGPIMFHEIEEALAGEIVEATAEDAA